MKNPILHFFLLIFRVSFNITPDIIYKYDKFFKTFLKKSFKFIPYTGTKLVMFKPDLMLLPIKANFLLEKQNCKKDIFIVFALGNFKIVFALPVKVKIVHVQLLEE